MSSDNKYDNISLHVHIFPNSLTFNQNNIYLAMLHSCAGLLLRTSSTVLLRQLK